MIYLAFLQLAQKYLFKGKKKNMFLMNQLL